MDKTAFIYFCEATFSKQLKISISGWTEKQRIEKEADLSNLMKNYFGKITCGVDFDLIKFFWFDSILIWFHSELELNGLHLHTEFIWFGLAGGGACLG